MAPRKKKLLPKECAVCGETFYNKDDRIRCCSRSCGGKLGNTEKAREKAQKTRLERYGDKNYNNREKVKKTVQEKYGEEYINTSQVPHIKEKIVKTYTKRHGGMGMSSESASKKTLETTKEKYGVKDDESITNTFQIKEVIEKIKETHEERWGGIGFASEELAERSLSTYKELYGEDLYDSPYRSSLIAEAVMNKYGTTAASKVPEIKDKLVSNYIEKHGGMGNARDAVKIKLQKDLNKFKELYESKKYTNVEIENIMGVSKSTLGAWAKRLGIELSTPNRLNETWKLYLLEETGVEFEYEGAIYDDNVKKVDLYNDNLKLAIEINPTITHSTQPSIFHGVRVPVKYHQNRAIMAEENGWHLIQVFDWDKPEDIVTLIKSIAQIEQNVIYARQCQKREIPIGEASSFISAHHRQGSKAKASIAYGLYYKDELVQVMTFSKERFVKSSEDSYELLRLVSKGGLVVVGGASRLMSTFVNSDYRPTRIKTFVDYSKGQGKVYEKIGMNYIGLANLNAYYSNINTDEAIKVTAVTKKFKKEYEKLGITQQEYMNSKRFYRINDAGNKIYEWVKKDR